MLFRSPKDKLPEIHDTLNRINDLCWAGAFTYWETQRLMVYRYGLVLAGGQIAGPEQIDTMIKTAVSSAERFYPAFQLVAWANETPEEAMKVAIAEAYGRALPARALGGFQRDRSALTFPRIKTGNFMDMQNVERRGLVLLGCGKMGSAMLQGWLSGGLPTSSVWVLDPYPSEWLLSLDGLNLNSELPADPAIVLIAVKPQMMGQALPVLQALGNGTTLFLSVAAGTPMLAYEAVLGDKTPIVRAMPNTPAAI